jgi:ATP-dependent DNA ligase
VVPRSPIVPPPKKPKAKWTRPEVLVEVEYPNKADDGRIRHPRFKGLRDDLVVKTVPQRKRAGPRFREDAKRLPRRRR